MNVFTMLLRLGFHLRTVSRIVYRIIVHDFFLTELDAASGGFSSRI